MFGKKTDLEVILINDTKLQGELSCSQFVECFLIRAVEYVKANPDKNYYSIIQELQKPEFQIRVISDVLNYFKQDHDICFINSDSQTDEQHIVKQLSDEQFLHVRKDISNSSETLAGKANIYKWVEKIM